MKDLLSNSKSLGNFCTEKRKIVNFIKSILDHCKLQFKIRLVAKRKQGFEILVTELNERNYTVVLSISLYV